MARRFRDSLPRTRDEAGRCRRRPQSCYCARGGSVSCFWGETASMHGRKEYLMARQLGMPPRSQRFARRYSTSSGSPMARMALRRMLPATTMLPMMLTRSRQSTEESLLPARARSRSTMSAMPWMSTAGPDAVPPKPLMGAPAPRTQCVE
jgi:hypothetical protein